MKAISLIFVLFIVNLYAQNNMDILPFKGKYIYYSFPDTLQNTKRCLSYYSSSIDDKNSENLIAEEFSANVTAKIMAELGSYNIGVFGLKTQEVTFAVPTKMIKGCSDDVIGEFEVHFPKPNDFFVNKTILGRLATIGKFKISDIVVNAQVKVIFNSKNSFELIFTNFNVTYAGTIGGDVKIETIPLEEVYNSVISEEAGDKMYELQIKQFSLIDDFVKTCNRVYLEELIRTYEIDEL